MTSQTETLLPELEARLAALQSELMAERQIVAEIEACDPEELKEARSELAGQG